MITIAAQNVSYGLLKNVLTYIYNSYRHILEQTKKNQPSEKSGRLKAFVQHFAALFRPEKKRGHATRFNTPDIDQTVLLQSSQTSTHSAVAQQLQFKPAAATAQKNMPSLQAVVEPHALANARDNFTKSYTENFLALLQHMQIAAAYCSNYLYDLNLSLQILPSFADHLHSHQTIDRRDGVDVNKLLRFSATASTDDLPGVAMPKETQVNSKALTHTPSRFFGAGSRSLPRPCHELRARSFD